MISLIFAGRNRMVMIRRELPRTRVASTAKPVAQSEEDSPSCMPRLRLVLASSWVMLFMG